MGLIILVLSMLFCMLTEALCAESSSGGRAIYIINDVHDFGEVSPNAEPLKYSFKLENRGTSAVAVVDAATSCGCTIVNAIKGKVIQPKEIYELPVQFSMFGISGPKTSEIKIVLSSGDVISLKLKAFGDRLSTVSPAAIKREVSIKGRIVQDFVILKRVKNDSLRLDDSDFEFVSDKAFGYHFKSAHKLPVADGEKSFIVRYKFQVYSSVIENAIESVIQIGFKDGETFRVPIKIEVIPSVRFIPATAMIGTIKKGSKIIFSSVLEGIEPDDVIGIFEGGEMLKDVKLERVESGSKVYIPLLWNQKGNCKRFLIAKLKGSPSMEAGVEIFAVVTQEISQ